MPKKTSTSRSQSRIEIYGSRGSRKRISKRNSIKKSVGRKLASITVAELKSIAKHLKISIPAGMKKPEIISKLKRILTKL